MERDHRELVLRAVTLAMTAARTVHNNAVIAEQRAKDALDAAEIAYETVKLAIEHGKLLP